MRITVAIPTHENVPARFMYDLAQLSAYTVAALPEDTQFGIAMVSGTYVHAARNELAQALPAEGVDYILWLDSDMSFPRDALVKLLRHKLPMVGINYAKRGVPSGFVAIKKVGVPGEPLRTLDDSTGLEEVEACGFGLVLMKVRALAGMPDPQVQPWFQNVYLGEGRWMGEDVHFCERFREAGNRIFVDHDLSKQCSHLGQFEYGLAHAAAEELVSA